MASMYLDFLSKFGVGGAHPGGFNLTKEILKAEEIDQTSRILDAGCGTGQTSAYLAGQYGAQVTGLEINPIMIEKAKNRMANYQLPVKIVQGSVEYLPFETGHFDYVISESVLAFVNKPRSLLEIHRVLKNGGRFIANEFTINHPINIGSEQEIKQFYGLDSVPMERDWIKLFEKAGFRDIKIPRRSEPVFSTNPTLEYQYSEFIEPELYGVFIQHLNIMMKYQGILDHRIITCTK